jgi:UDP-N-acetyl-D-glucosamine dehydrogenase
MKTTLSKKLNNKSAIIGIFGLGYVGIPLMIRFAEVGYKVIGFEVDNNKIESLNIGQSYIDHIDSNQIKFSLENGFEATSDYSRASEADVLILCLPTPLNKYKEPDLSYVTNTMDNLVPYLRVGHLISLESTTYPGTTEEELLPRIESGGFSVGEEIFLVYSPEREDPGNSSFSTQTIPKVVGGYSANCMALGEILYKAIIDQIVMVSSTKAAEMTKLLENIHRAVNIGLVNEMKTVADKMSIDINEVINAAATKPFGFTPYFPGPGLGGHCIPIDPFYLTWKAREYGIHTRFIELAGEVNASMPGWVVEKVSDALNVRKKPVNGSMILILGIAYKKNIEDLRESPALEIIKLLQEMGAHVDYTDPHVSSFRDSNNSNSSLKSINLSPEEIVKYDALVLVTDHDKFDYSMIKSSAKLIIDTRGVYLNANHNIVKA